MGIELNDLDVTTIGCGDLVAQANKALAEAIGHCERHPGIEKARVVKIEVFIEPEFHPETDEFSLNIKFYAVPVVPKTFGKADRAKRQADGRYVVAGPHAHVLETKQLSIGENVTPMRKA